MHDHFDDGVLDPSWSIELNQYAESWSYAETGTHLIVDDIVANYTTSNTIVPPATVSLSRPVSPTGEFHAYFDFSWDSANDVQAMQGVSLSLLDGNSDTVARVGYDDAWVQWSGVPRAYIGAAYADGNLLPLQDAAASEIIRTGDAISVLWNGATLYTGTAANPVEEIQLTFEFYPYVGGYGTAFFETLSVDRVSFVPVPEPTTLSLLCIGALGVSFAWYRKRRASPSADIGD